MCCGSLGNGCGLYGMRDLNRWDGVKERVGINGVFGVKGENNNGR